MAASYSVASACSSRPFPFQCSSHPCHQEANCLSQSCNGSGEPPLFTTNFVVMELRKKASWSEVRPELYYFRTHAGQEVDIVLESRTRKLVAIEVKAGA